MKLAMQLKDYRLTTAEILYRLPDHPALLQSYVWQEMDLAPRYPSLRQFLDFWDRELDGKIHSVRVGSARLISPGLLRHAPHGGDRVHQARIRGRMSQSDDPGARADQSGQSHDIHLP